MLYKRVKNDFGEYFFLIFSDTECLATKQYNNTSQLTWWRDMQKQIYRQSFILIDSDHHT